MMKAIYPRHRMRHRQSGCTWFIRMHGLTFRMLYQTARSVYDIQITRRDMNFMVHRSETGRLKKKIPSIANYNACFSQIASSASRETIFSITVSNLTLMSSSMIAVFICMVCLFAWVCIATQFYVLFYLIKENISTFFIIT